jgi:hypothetical protein
MLLLLPLLLPLPLPLLLLPLCGRRIPLLLQQLHQHVPAVNPRRCQLCSDLRQTSPQAVVCLRMCSRLVT